MNILEQCNAWHKNEEYQKIIDTLELLPEEDHTPEIDSVLARAYNNIATNNTPEYYHKALALLFKHQEYFENDCYWHFRVAYSFFYLDRDNLALEYFEKTLELIDNQEKTAELQELEADSIELIKSCDKNLSIPHFSRNFATRVKDAWAKFNKNEEKLRYLIDNDEKKENAEEIITICNQILSTALLSYSFEIGKNETKYEIIISPQGNKANLFAVHYFIQNMPEQIQKNWIISACSPKNPQENLSLFDIPLNANTIKIWLEEKDNSVELKAYSEALLPLHADNPNFATYYINTFLDLYLGELANMRYINSIEVLENELDEEFFMLPEIEHKLAKYIDSTDNTYQSYLFTPIHYELEPIDEKDADLRFDIYSGNSLLPAIVMQYLHNEQGVFEEFYANGITAGFLVFENEYGKSPQAIEVRNLFMQSLQEKLGNSICIIGAGSGLYHNYIDLLAFEEIDTVFRIAKETADEFFIRKLYYRSVRRDTNKIILVDKDEIINAQIHKETNSILSPKNIEDLENFLDDNTGYYGKMMEYLDKFIKEGIGKGLFTKAQAQEDLLLSLWYGFAYNNFGTYLSYYFSKDWMQHAEKNAKGCGTWYYRYAVSLLHTGEVEKAYTYALQGSVEEPDYPWIWLKLAKLHAHFNKKEEALQAVAKGLELVPEDYEFLTLKREILENAPLEKMLYHWINEEQDIALQNGEDNEAQDKIDSIQCVLINHQNLEVIKEKLVNAKKYEANSPYCTFEFEDYSLEFQMNEAGLSKFNTETVNNILTNVQNGLWLFKENKDNEIGKLQIIKIKLSGELILVYKISDEERYFEEIVKLENYLLV